jgi:hypothetical protein
MHGRLPTTEQAPTLACHLDGMILLSQTNTDPGHKSSAPSGMAVYRRQNSRLGTTHPILPAVGCRGSLVVGSSSDAMSTARVARLKASGKRAWPAGDHRGALAPPSVSAPVLALAAAHPTKVVTQPAARPQPDQQAVMQQLQPIDSPPLAGPPLPPGAAGSSAGNAWDRRPPGMRCSRRPQIPTACSRRPRHPLGTSGWSEWCSIPLPTPAIPVSASDACSFTRES